MTPSVSLIIPGWNCAATLPACLDSVLAQSFRNFELIFVNDGSTDDSAEIAEIYRSSFQAAGISFRVVKQENQGQAAAMNTGLALANGRYLAWLDADDLLHPDNLRAKVDFLQSHPEFGMVRCNGICRQADGAGPDGPELFRPKERYTGNIFEALFAETTSCANGCYLIAAELFFQCYPERRIPVSSAGQNLQMLLPPASRSECGWVDQTLFIRMIYPDSHSHRPRSYTEARQRNDEFYRLRLKILEHCQCDQEKFAALAAQIHRREFRSIISRSVMTGRQQLQRQTAPKAGIATFITADNYGAQLQAYALFQSLKRCGIDSEFLPIPPHEEMFSLPANIPHPVQKALRRKWETAKSERHKHFEEFRTAHLPLCREPLERWNHHFDFFLAGSDQVWNPEITGTNELYFLPFAAPAKRCSYAASFGGQPCRLPADRPLAAFRHLSVREKSGIPPANELGGSKVEVHPDPVFLPTALEWRAVAGATPNHPQKYLLLYYIVFDAEMKEYANQLAARTGLDIRLVCAEWMLNCGDAGITAWSQVGVLDFLNLALHAEFIVGNSFHAAALAVIFHKQFHFFPLRGSLSPRNTRILELKKRLGLNFDGRDSWEQSDRTLAEWRESAYGYLELLRKEYAR